MERYSKSFERTAGIKAKERKKFLLTMEGCDAEADREAWIAFEDLLNRKAASAPTPAPTPTPAAAAPIGNPAPPAPAVAEAPPAAGAAAPQGAPPAPLA